MNRTEMLKRLEAGESPLKLVKEKWQDIKSGKGKNHGANNCAFCEVYFGCTNCPMWKKTGHKACRGTPYYVYTHARRFGTKEEENQAIDAMIKFIDDLEEVE